MPIRGVLAGSHGPSVEVDGNPVFHPCLSRYPVIVVIRSSCLAAFALLVPTANAQQIPVLTVCEALHELPKYNGKVVIVVGRTFFTFEGSFMNEKCEPDGTTMVQGKKWLSVIAFGSGKTNRAIVVQWDPEALDRKLKQVQQTTHLESQNTSPFIDGWSAVCGRLEAPQKLRPPTGSRHRFRPGNGYGANGSVPARLQMVQDHDFPR